jgi:hypothetical protein
MAWLNEEALDILVNYYYPKAKWLQNNCNWGKLPYVGPEATFAVKDDLMQWIDIYDCYTRNAAGFSNVLQDLKYMTQTPKWHHPKDGIRKHGFMFICPIVLLDQAHLLRAIMDTVTMLYSIGAIFGIFKICKSICFILKLWENLCLLQLVTNRLRLKRVSQI